MSTKSWRKFFWEILLNLFVFLFVSVRCCFKCICLFVSWVVCLSISFIISFKNSIFKDAIIFFLKRLISSKQLLIGCLFHLHRLLLHQVIRTTKNACIFQPSCFQSKPNVHLFVVKYNNGMYLNKGKWMKTRGNLSQKKNNVKVTRLNMRSIWKSVCFNITIDNGITTTKFIEHSNIQY